MSRTKQGVRVFDRTGEVLMSDGVLTRGRMSERQGDTAEMEVEEILDNPKGVIPPEETDTSGNDLDRDATKEKVS